MASKPRSYRAKPLRSKRVQIKTARGKVAVKKAKTPKSKTPKSLRDKVRAYRKRMRAKGLPLVQMWLPDTSTPEFKKQAHPASLAVANSPTEKEDQAFIDSVSWWNSEEAAALARSEPDHWWKEPWDLGAAEDG